MSSQPNTGRARWARSFLLCFCLGFLSLEACLPVSPVPPEFDERSQAVVYGKDDRIDTYKHKDAKLRALAGSVVMLLSSSRVKIDGKTGNVTLTGDLYKDKIRKSSNYGKGKLDLCKEEPFQNDPAPGSCSGFLVGKRTIMTAGHCISKTTNLSPAGLQRWCNGRYVVFDFKRLADGTVRQLKRDDVYRCKRVTVHRYMSSPTRLDIGAFELERDVKGRTPLTYNVAPNLKVGEPLAIIGHPHGVLQKIASGAEVTDARTKEMDWFRTNIDSSPGNSGSPVFSLSSYEVVGVHVRGARPVFSSDTKRQCLVTHTRKEKPGVQSANYTAEGQSQPCEKDEECRDKRQRCEQKVCRFPSADITIKSMSLSASSGKKGTPVTVQFTIVNQGTLSFTQGFRVSVWWSANADICVTCGNDKRLVSKTFAGMKGGETISGALVVPADAPLVYGKQYLGLYVDDANLSGDSWTGFIGESDERNNEKSLPYTLERCKDACPKEGATQCQGQRVDVCAKNSDGCLAWKAGSFCESYEVCQQGKCQRNCKDLCTKEGELRCKASAIETCTRQTNGCLDWKEDKQCDAKTSLCEKGACVPKPKVAEGEPCEADDDCKSQQCSNDVCTRRCLDHPDCVGAKSGPFCDKNICTPIPKGACFENKDCGADATCQEKKCVPKKKEPTKPVPKPEDTGCGCATTTPKPAPRSLWWCLLALLLFRRVRHEKCKRDGRS